MEKLALLMGEHLAENTKVLPQIVALLTGGCIRNDHNIWRSAK